MANEVLVKPPTMCAYARTSTCEQNLDMQRNALRAYGCELIFEDAGVSGGVHPLERERFQAALAMLKHDDILVVWKLDRLGRSVTGIIETIEHLQQRGIQLVSLTENIQTNTAMGKAFMQFIALLAELERGLVSERTREGLRAAKARGQRLGRPFVLTDHVVRAAHRKWLSGMGTLREIALSLQVSERTLRRGFRRLGLSA